MLSKKGETESNIELWFLVMALSFALILGIFLLEETLHRLSGDDLRKKVVAGEVALIIDAAYAASYGFEYDYYLPDEKTFCVTVNNEEGRVEVTSGTGSSEVPYAHRIVRVNLADQNDEVEILEIQSESECDCGNNPVFYKITKDIEYNQDGEKISNDKIKIVCQNA